MQVKKYEASSVIEALQEVKRDLGPDAIILSTQEAKRSMGGRKTFIVVAAVSETHVRKKEIAERTLGDVFEKKVQSQSAVKQKMFIDNVYRGIEKKHEARNRQITRTPYIDIGEGIDDEPVAQVIEQSAPAAASGISRVQQAAKEAFKTSLNSDFFNDERERAAGVTRSVKKDLAPQIPQHIANMSQRLKNCGVEGSIRSELERTAIRELGSGAERRALVDSFYAKWILSEISVKTQSVDSMIEIFVGPEGVGKTSALVKLATHYVVEAHKKIAIITTDLNKVGGVEQLRVYSRILNAPVFVARDPYQLQQKIEELRGYDKILVDTPGISLSNMQELDFVRAVTSMSSERGQSVHLVLSALTKEGDLGGILKRFRVAQFDDVIVTNIDQTSQHGILLNIQRKIEQPFHSFSIGSDIVDGFELASRERVLDLIFKLTKKIGEKGNDSRI